MCLMHEKPIVLPPIGTLFVSSRPPTPAFMICASEEQREQHEEVMARYFGVPLANGIRKTVSENEDTANMRTPTSVQPCSGFPHSSPVKKDCARTKEPLPLLHLNSPVQMDLAHTIFREEEKLRVSRERNRLHAQRTRVRKRELLESLTERIGALQNEYELIKQAFDFHVTAVCLLRLSNVINIPCVQTLEQVGIDSLEDRDEDGQVYEVVSFSLDSDNDGDHDENDEPEQLNANNKRPYASTISSNNVFADSKEEREHVRRERNRLHARRARLRKKVVLEKSQQAVSDLRRRNDRLRNRLSELVSSIYGPETRLDDPDATL
ncbi:hypothetical protein CCR75_003942 [Bremia lactucae]|uniref:BZIP domain-containing protein n=1 Tax=Bremia lactucae TaxID=4779 RepID=A0A976FMH0_BRELC|nr:hypothetical protein CCR75_003942 [Bremia lactucae]